MYYLSIANSKEQRNNRAILSIFEIIFIILLLFEIVFIYIILSE